MKCRCGAELESGARFCSNCGASVTLRTQTTTHTSASRWKQFLMMCVIVGLLLSLIGWGGEYATGRVLDILKEEMIDPSDTSGMSELFADYLGDTAKDLVVSVIRGDPGMLKTGVKSMTDLFEKGSEEDPFTESLASMFLNSMVEPLFNEARATFIEEAGVFWPLLQVVAYYPEFQMIGLVLLVGGAVLLFVSGYRPGEQPRVKKHVFASVLITLVIVVFVAHIDVPSLAKQVVELVQTSGQTGSDEAWNSGYITDSGTQTSGGNTSQHQEATATPKRATATPRQATATPRQATATPRRTTAPTQAPVQSSSRYPLFTDRRVYPVGSTVEVSIQSANVRTGPGTGYAGAGAVGYGQRYYVYGFQLGDTGKDWYQIRVNGRDCWISSGLVMIDGYLDGTVSGIPIVPEMTDRRCTIRSAQANARSGPGTSYAVVSQVYAGETYDILACTIGSTGKDWYKINRNGQTCWISSELTYVNGYGGGTVEGVLIDPDAYR